jgi:hypothetical protein
MLRMDQVSYCDYQKTPHPTVAPQVYYAPLIILAEAITPDDPMRSVVSDREIIWPTLNDDATKSDWLFQSHATNLEWIGM